MVLIYFFCYDYMYIKHLKAILIDQALYKYFYYAQYHCVGSLSMLTLVILNICTVTSVVTIVIIYTDDKSCYLYVSETAPFTIKHAFILKHAFII